MSLPIWKRPRRFVDIETTGLSQKENGEIDYDLHEIVEITITDEYGVALLDTKVKPIQIETAHPKALEINGYTEEGWKDAPTFEQIAPMVVELLTHCVIVGQNAAQFDYPRIKHWASKYTDTSKMGYHVVDTVTLIEEHLVPLGCKRLSLAPACDFVGIPLVNAHRSAVDIEATRRLYYKLRRANRFNRFWWWVRNKVRTWGK